MLGIGVMLHYNEHNGYYGGFWIIAAIREANDESV